MKETERSCIDCGAANCIHLDKKFPDFCTTEKMDPALLEKAMGIYREDEETHLAAIKSAEVEAENYCKMTRVEETMEFAKKMGAKRLGIAACAGLLREARTVAKIFRKHGFEVYGAACKIGVQKKETIGIELEPEVLKEVGAMMCNPVLQACWLNEQKVDLNVLIGLCVGHDSLFCKYSDALCTTLVAKDRVLGHNPAAAIYQAESYYSRLLK